VDDRVRAAEQPHARGGQPPRAARQVGVAEDEDQSARSL
jgi:hypothetical protein